MHLQSVISLPVIALLGCVSLSACGGGGSGDGSGDGSNGGDRQGWVAGQYLPADSFAAQCAAPRTATDPNTGQPLFDDLPGSVVDENNWLRSWTHDLYLWYDEVPDLDPALHPEPIDYFEQLRTTALTDSGNPKDRFHFALDTAQWQAESQQGIRAGYGMEFVVLEPYPPRLIAVSYTHPGSPAALAGITRGFRIVAVDGEDAVNGDTQAIVDVINGGLYPAATGETHTFEVVAPGSGVPQTLELTAQEVTIVPVQDVGTVTSPQGASVGYLHFTDHIATAETALIDAIEQLAAESVEDLVIDVRYNGGGYLAVAAQLAYMVAGEVRTAGRIFESIEFNQKHPTTNPVTGTPIAPLPFLDVTIGLADAVPNQPLPTLNLDRVFVITGPRTCSASESIINSLRGVGVEVIQIGSRTCGKPYGFYPTDNCGTTYFSIQFRGVNDAGFGDYADGFAPAGFAAPSAASPPGCSVPDDFDFMLGDVHEARLAAALHFRDAGDCPLLVSSATLTEQKLHAVSEPAAGQLPLESPEDPPWRTNRILTPW